jgi:hypothetical protein
MLKFFFINFVVVILFVMGWLRCPLPINLVVVFILVMLIYKSNMFDKKWRYLVNHQDDAIMEINHVLNS